MIVKAQKYFFSKPFFTEGGEQIKKPEIAYEEYGNPKGELIYILHGAYSHFHAAGKYQKNDALPGFWDALIGKGKAIDTNRFRVIAANTLGSMHGSSSPLSINPDTQKPYGPTFPKITIRDMANFHKSFLNELGIEKLFMIAGPSIGSMQSLSMAQLYPDFVQSVFAVATGAYLPPYTLALHLVILELFKSSPAFSNGNYTKEDMFHAMKNFQLLSRFIYFNEAFFEDISKSSHNYDKKVDTVTKFMYDNLEELASSREPNCLIKIIDAMNDYNLAKGYKNLKEGLEQIKAKVLLVNFDTDLQLFARQAVEIAEILNDKNPNQAWLRNKKSKMGHYACVFEAENFKEDLKEFIQSLS